MAVTAQTPFSQFTAAPGATVFSSEFRVLQASDLVVKVNGAVIASGFSVSGIGAAGGVDVTFSTPMTGGEVVELLRDIPLTRATDYQQLGDFLAPVVNLDFDRLWMSQQDQESKIGSSLRLPFPEQVQELPAASARIRKLFYFDETGAPVMFSGTPGTVLGFNSSGDPVAVVPASGSAADLALYLASPASGKGAEMIRWIRNAAGAASLWVSEKLSETVGIKDFAAVVDGVADDTTPIQKARTAADGKFPILFGGKTYASGYWENLSPLIQEWVLGSNSDYKTDVVSTKPLTSTKLFTGTPQTGPGFAAYGHRTDIYTKAGVDVASSVGFASVVNALSTNSGGSATNNNTNQVAILANASAQSTTASAPVTAINAIAASAHTGATWQQVVGVEVDVGAANPPGYFGDASKTTGFGVSCVLMGSSAYSATAAYGADTGKSGAGWLHGALLSGCVNTGVTIARNTVTPHTGVWVSAAGTYGVYIGAKPLHQLQPGQVPTYSAQHNPAIGIALGQTAETNGRSNYLRFTATDGSSIEQHFDLYSTATALLLRFAGSDKFAVSSTGAVSINGTQVLSNRDTGFSLMTGTQNKATVYDTSSVTLQQLAQRVAALQQALTAHGIIGA